MLCRALASLSIVVALSACGRSAFDRSDLSDHVPRDAGTEDADSGPPPVVRSGKVDLLLVVDNSRNLETAHELLAGTLPYLITRLVSPACVNGLGNVVAQPASQDEPCPVGERDFAPVRDLHIAVVSTSLGGHGADICGEGGASFHPQMNDAAHLLTRTAAGGVVPTYADAGFLAWDPGQAMAPPGDSDEATMVAKLLAITGGVGTKGCGFESQLESIYRFLVDPRPYAQIAVEGTTAVLQGTDDLLLQQRSDFLRPDSVVVTVLLSDENDCSTREGGQYFLAGQALTPGGTPFHLPRPRSECADDPPGPCCASCGQPTPAGCPETQANAGCALPPFDAIEDAFNLRCFDQKRRFGIDFLHPIDRYVKGFTQATVADRDGNVVDNPLLAGGRPPEHVIFAGIVGVPWQDIATDPNALATGYQPAEKIDWRAVIGDPSVGAPPEDPLMRESIEPRSGTNPATLTDLAPPGASSPQASPINGHERLLPARDDLQYACIFPRPTPQDCTGNLCECELEEGGTNPICQASDGSYSSVQRYARALPGLRQLRVLHDLGESGVVGSICAEVVKGTAQPTYGYKPAVDAIMRSLRKKVL